MQGGWYCRTMASEQAEHTNEMESTESDDSHQDQDRTNKTPTLEGKEKDYKKEYKSLKAKIKYLIYDNESHQESLRSNQRRLLKATRDRIFLLDRLLQYEKAENTTSESEDTESSEEEIVKRPKIDIMNSSSSTNGLVAVPAKRGRKKKSHSTHAQAGENAVIKNTVAVTETSVAVTSTTIAPNLSESVLPQLSRVPAVQTQDSHAGGHMSAAEIEQHLQSKQMVVEPIMPERTVPVEMFSNEPSLDSDSNDAASPIQVAAEECVE